MNKCICIGAMKCLNCETAKEKPWHGYSMTCPQCCCRLVLSARPSKPHAAGMLAAIGMYPHAPGRVEILECVRQRLEKSQLDAQKSLLSEG